MTNRERVWFFKCASGRRNVCWETLKTIILMYPEVARFAVISYDIPASVRKALDNGSVEDIKI